MALGPTANPGGAGECRRSTAWGRAGCGRTARPVREGADGEAPSLRERHDGLIVGPPKSEAGRRTVALPAGALASLADHLSRFTGLAPSDWVFTGEKGGPVREAVWQHEWAKARAGLGMPGLHFHDLRHAAATLAATTGAGVKEIMYRIGHSSPQAALRYQHASARRDLAIAAGIEDLIRLERAATRPEDPSS